MKIKTTEELSNVLNKIKDKKELNNFISSNKQNINTASFIEYVNKIILEKNLTKSKVVNNSLISRTYAYQILQGIKKPTRDKIISLCLACEMNLEETQRSLTIAQSGKLYSKNKRDSIIIFAINSSLSVMETNELLYEMNENILE